MIKGVLVFKIRNWREINEIARNISNGTLFCFDILQHQVIKIIQLPELWIEQMGYWAIASF